MVVRARIALDNPVPSDYRNLSAIRRLVVRHPGYEDGKNDLFALVATDGDADAPGIQMNIVHTVCAVVANNRFDGWLSQSRDPRQPRPAITLSDLLPTGAYYFHVPITEEHSDALDRPYPIVPNFHSWTFPHDQLPPMWATAPLGSLTQSIAAKFRDSTCRITQCSESTESAHIVPRRERDWFAANEMDRYCCWSNRYGRDTADSDENMVQLRMDLHDSWDRMLFSIVPKHDNGQSLAWVIHVNSPSQELHHIYHNRTLQHLSGIAREFLFARFIWDMIHRTQGFLQRGVPRRLVVRGIVGDYNEEQCRSFCEKQGMYRSARSSRSSTKRQCSEIDVVRESGGTSFDSGITDFSTICSSNGSGKINRTSQDDRDSDDDSSDEVNETMIYTNDCSPWKEAAPLSHCIFEADIYGERRRREQQELEQFLHRNDDPYGERRRREQQELEQFLHRDDDPYGERRRREQQELEQFLHRDDDPYGEKRRQAQRECNSDRRGRKRRRS